MILIGLVAQAYVRELWQVSGIGVRPVPQEISFL